MDGLDTKGLRRLLGTPGHDHGAKSRDSFPEVHEHGPEDRLVARIAETVVARYQELSRLLGHPFATSVE
jgi:hypothetical protein